jgi:hypothetical protein
MRALDRRSHNAAEKVAPYSPLISKLINDGSYLRALLGTVTLALPLLGIILGAISLANSNGVMTPPWALLLTIAMLGLFDASAGFAAAATFIIGSLVTVAVQTGNFVSLSQLRTLMGVMVIAIGPALLTTAFRTLRKHPALDFNAWWERITDLAIAPFMASWSIAAMVSVLPALAGTTLPVANHVADFAFFIAIAALARTGLEEFTARYYPARLNTINPDEIPEPLMAQRVLGLVVKYAIWIFVSGALIGEGWQIWVGSALFLVPTLLGWFADRFPNLPALWRILPGGIPGLALSLVIATLTTSLVGAWLGATPALAQWSFVILPMPLLVLSLLGLFGRHGQTPDEEKPSKTNKWIYRIGGLVMLVVTLKLAGVI